MPLSKQEQDELDALELAELEHKERGDQALLPEEGLNGGDVRSSTGGALGTIADLISPSFTKSAGNSAIDTAAFGNAGQAVKDASNENQAGNLVGKAAGMALMSAAGGAPVTAAKTGLGRIGASAASNGLQGFLQKPAGEDSLASRAQNGFVSGLIGGGLQTAGEGANKLGDWLMQKAVGMKKYMPGVGEKLADEGVIGTKGMMKGQVEKALPAREAELQDAVKGLKGTVDPEPVANAVRGQADKFIPTPGPSGPMPIQSDNLPAVNQATSRADEIMIRGALHPEEALSLSRTAARGAYGANGQPLNQFGDKLAQTEGISLKDAIKEMADAQDAPAVREALAKEAALLNAKKGLNKPESMQSVVGKMLLKAGIGGGVGYELGGGAGAAAGALASTPLGQSALGRSAIGASKAIPYISPLLIDALNKAKRDGEVK
jgi:hypothetical protein